MPQASAPAASTRAWPLTRPEATNYTETSRYDEVVAFMKAMAAASPRIHVTTYGYTFEGRPMPLAVIGAPGATPEQVLATGKTRIYIQGNIHAGEVEGKEAALWLLRSIAKGERAAWFQHVVLLINPIYNADGNERVSVRNRGSQFGPIGGMGQRANAENLDLNRDNTKLETAEARSLARLLTQYDPHIAIDLHTTNGSDHGFYLTYETSVSPNTSPGITSLVRGDLLPAVTKAVKARHGWSYFYYGGPTRSGERAVGRRSRSLQAALHADVLRDQEPDWHPLGNLLIRELRGPHQGGLLVPRGNHQLRREARRGHPRSHGRGGCRVDHRHAAGGAGPAREGEGPGRGHTGRRRRRAEPVRARPPHAPARRRQRTDRNDAASRPG